MFLVSNIPRGMLAPEEIAFISPFAIALYSLQLSDVTNNLQFFLRYGYRL